MPDEPASYNYRRAALDALHFPKLVDRWWQNLRRCAGYKVQYFAAIEPQDRLAAHLHAAVRGAIPRSTIRQVTRATYVQVWWPPHDRPVYLHRRPAWSGTDYCDPDTGEILPTWDEAVAELAADPEAKPAHVMHFGSQLDVRGIIAPSEDADRAIRYLTKYLAKAISEPLAVDGNDSARSAHVDRLHHEVLWLPCSPRCANWLRYGIQPDHAGRASSPAGVPRRRTTANASG